MSERRFAIIEEQIANLNKMAGIVSQFMEACNKHIDRIDEKLEQLRQMYARHQSLIEPNKKFSAENKKPPPGPCQAGAFDEAEAYTPSRHLDGWDDACYGCATGRCSAHQDGPLEASHDEFLKAKYWD